MNFKIDPEFKACCRKLTDDEYKALENMLLNDGCLDPIKHWEGIIVDGHNRYEICKKHKIDFNTQKLSFENREEVLLWMIDLQVGRRNLTDLDKVALLESKRPILEKQAKERQSEAGGDRKSEDAKSVKVNLPEAISKAQVRDQLASEAGISGKTYDNLRTVNQRGSEELKEAVREKKIGASTAAKIAVLPVKDQKEIVEKKITGAPKQEKGISINKALGNASSAMWQADEAIMSLEKILTKDPMRQQAYDKVINWINNNRGE